MQKLSKEDLTKEELLGCRQYAEYIETQSQRCKQIVEDLLDFSKKADRKYEVLDVRTPIENTINFLKHSLESKKIQVSLDHSRHEPFLVKANANQLQQVFTNLVVNAMHAMEDGGKLSIYVMRIKKDKKDFVRISFTDTGCGIPKEQLLRIFEPFYTTKKQWRSAGLGLSICYQILKQHKGDISVESTLGKGSTFYVTLPYFLQTK
jgi:signal transduction histidine kinase